MEACNCCGGIWPASVLTSHAEGPFCSGCAEEIREVYTAEERKRDLDWEEGLYGE